jgi:hypothetical protein
MRRHSHTGGSKRDKLKEKANEIRTGCYGVAVALPRRRGLKAVYNRAKVQAEADLRKAWKREARCETE